MPSKMIYSDWLAVMHSACSQGSWRLVAGLLKMQTFVKKGLEEYDQNKQKLLDFMREAYLRKAESGLFPLRKDDMEGLMMLEELLGVKEHASFILPGQEVVVKAVRLRKIRQEEIEAESASYRNTEPSMDDEFGTFFTLLESTSAKYGAASGVESKVDDLEDLYASMAAVAPRLEALKKSMGTD